MKNKVVRRSLADQAYSIVLDKIHSGELAPGTRLNIEELSAEIGVSRTPMREAISKLIQDGFAESQLNVGPSVIAIDEVKIEEMCIANTFMMEGIIELAFDEYKTGGTLERLESIIQLQRNALNSDDIKKFREASISFHEVLITACKNKTLVDFALSTQVHLDAFVNVYQRGLPNVREMSIADHTAILEALKRNNLEATKHALHEHNTRPIEFFQKQYQIAPEP